jgi:hypothetical protein
MKDTRVPETGRRSTEHGPERAFLVFGEINEAWTRAKGLIFSASGSPISIPRSASRMRRSRFTRAGAAVRL